MLVTLAEMKTYLGITGTTYDTFLTEQITLVSDVIENYCRRKFLTATYAETFYRDDFEELAPKVIETFHYPIQTITSVIEDITTLAVTDYRAQKDYGILTSTSSFFRNGDPLVITYTAGADTAPTPVRSVVFSIVEERYNKKVAGVALNFGSDVQRVSIPGTISIDFDYTLTKDERNKSFGNLIGPYANMLDPYRSERAIMGAGRLTYVTV